MDMKYNAFISYKHSEKENAVALKLQTLLEHLHVPAEGKNIFKKDKSKRIERIFMDSGELSSSADFLAQVESALENSEWLIVLCSPGSQASPWCALEVDTFLKYHSQDHILLLLVEGEPEEAFPVKLLEQDMSTLHILAADCRGDSTQEMLKKLKKNALYQLAAPILGLRYDDLKQRHKTYLMQRLMAASMAALVILSGFTGFTLYQARQIQKNYEKSRENQARFLTTISAQFLSEGDIDSALLTATAIRPKDIQTGPIVPEQFYSLNKSLGSYLFNNAYLPEKTVELGKYNKMIPSPDQTYSYICSTDKLTVFSNEKKEIVWEYTKKESMKQMEEAFPDDYYFASFSDFEQVVPYGEDRVILFTQLGTHILNVKDHTCERSEKLYTSQVAAIQGDALLLHTNSLDKYNLNLYDAKSLTLQKTIDLSEFKSEEYNEFPTVNLLKLSPDGKYAAFSLKTNVVPEYYNKDLGSGTYLIHLKSGKKTLISADTAEQIEFLDNNRIGLFLSHISDYDSEYRLDDMKTRTYSAGIYDISSGNMSFHRDFSDNITAKTNIRKINLTTEDKKIEAVAFSLNGELNLYDLKKNKIIFNTRFHNYICDVFEESDSYFYVILANGSTHLLSLIEGIQPGNGIYTDRLFCNLNTNIESSLYLRKEYAFLFFQNHKVIYAALKKDDHYKKIQTPEDTTLTVDTIEYTGKDSIYRIITFQDTVEYNDRAFSVYPVGEADPIYHWKADSDCSIFAKDFWMQEDRLIAAIVESNDSQQNAYVLHLLDITHQKELCKMPVGDFYGALSKMVFSEKENRIYISNRGKEYRDGISVLELKENQLVEVAHDLCPENRVDTLALSGSKDAFLILGSDKNHLSTPIGSVYTFDTKEISNVGFDPEEITFGFDTFSPVAAENTSMIFLKTTDAKPYLVDLKDPEHPIFIKETINRNATFFDQDQYLLFTKEESLCLYDIKAGKIISTYRSDKLPDQAFQFRELTASKDGSFFTLNQGDGYYMDFEKDDGYYLNKMYLFYVDKNHNIYLYADSAFTHMSPDGQEISTTLAGCCFAPLYTYEDLVKQAEKKLDGKTLTEEELKNYISSEE